MLKFTKKKVVVLLIIVILGGALYFFLRGNKPQVEYTTEQVKRGDLIQTVSETGAIRAAEKINLNFTGTGKISKINVKIGDKVITDQILAELDNQSYVLKEKEAYASYLIARANLSKILAGATFEELGVSQANTDKAKSLYESALSEQEKTEKAVIETISQAKQKLSDLLSTSPIKSTYRQSVENRKTSALVVIEDKNTTGNVALDNVRKLLDDNDAESTLSAKDQSYLNNTKSYYDQSVPLLGAARDSLAQAKANPTEANIYKAVDSSIIALNRVLSALDSAYKSLEKSITSSDFTQTELDAYKSSISSHLTAVSAAISAEQTAKQNLVDALITLDDAISTAENSLATAEKNGDKNLATAKAQVDSYLEAWNVAKAQLAQTKASPRSQDISLSEAQVAQAEAAWELAKKQLEDSAIKAPINGVITEVNYKIGEQISASKNAIVMVGDNDYEVKVDISEADISKIKTGDAAEITLDSFGEDIKFKGEVSFIEPAETVIQDVIYYKVTVRLVHETENQNLESYYSGIKPGMTANVIITTAKKENVLYAPGRAILEKNGQGRIARILELGSMREVSVKIGLKGDGGMVEILEGLKEGEEVVTYVKETTK